MGLTVLGAELLHGARSGAAERGGLERELAWLTWLEPESEDCDSEAAWYGLPIPNSAARLISDGTGGMSSDLPAVPGLDRLGRLGGGVLDRSGPTKDSFRAMSIGPAALSFTLGRLILGSFEGLRFLESNPNGFLGKDSAPFSRGNVCDLAANRRGAGASPLAGNGGPNPPYPLFLGTLGIPALVPNESGAGVCEAPVDVDGRGIFSGVAAVLVDIVASFKLRCLRCPLSGVGSLLAPFTPNGPGTSVFALCKMPPLVAVLGLTGAYIGPFSDFMPKPPYPPASGGRFFDIEFGESEGDRLPAFDEWLSGVGGLSKGAVVLRSSLPNGDRGGSLGIIGEALRDGGKLTGVS
jgi:hypothetical protein